MWRIKGRRTPTGVEEHSLALRPSNHLFKYVYNWWNTVDGRVRAGNSPPPPPHQHARARSRRTPLRHQRPTAVAPLTTNPHPFCFARYSSPQRAPTDLRLSSHVPRNFTAIGTHLCRPPLSFQGTKRFAQIRGRCRDAFRKKTLQHTTQFEVAFVVCSELRPAPLTTDSRREIDFWKLYEAHPLFL